MSGKKTVPGTVDRVEGDVIVVVAKDPDSGDNREIYVSKKKLKKIELREGDAVTVEMSTMTVEPALQPKSGKVQITFSGPQGQAVAKRFFAYLVDGGLEDHLIQELSTKTSTLEISDCDEKKLAVTFSCP
jgi:translation initiation factor IF-1